MPEGNFKVFVVEDNEWYNKLLVHSASLNPDFEVEGFHSGKDFLAALDRNPNVVTLDYRLPDCLGSDLFPKIKAHNENIEVIVISEQEDIEVAIEMLKAGAYDYMVKSKDIRDRLLNTLNHIRKQGELEKKVSRLQQQLEHKYDFQRSIIGNSKGIRDVFALIEKAASTNITVTVSGETGTGKELVAKALHFNSSRREKPFVAVNVAAIPAELIESELFGHEKGAFTGAVARRMGKFEEAAEGTLFLDEISELDMPLQAKLLRALQEKEVVPVGSNRVLKTNCRIVVATHKNLKEEVKKGNFREDLYFRLFGLTIMLPPLRERESDVLILAAYFIENFCRENKIPLKTISASAGQKLLNYSFPGNIRELKSLVEVGVVLSHGDEIESDNIMLGSEDALAEVIGEELTLREYEFRIISNYLKKYENDIPTVAQKLDVSVSTIYRMMKEFK